MEEVVYNTDLVDVSIVANVADLGTVWIKESDSGARFACGAEETLLCAALRAGQGLPYECSVGSCGSCKVQLVAGDVRHVCEDPPGLSSRDRAQGKHLACQSIPLSDCQIRFRHREEYIPIHPPVRYSAEFIGQRQITHDMREFKFRSQTEAVFLPGQYAMLSAPGYPGYRPYSMSNVPNMGGEWHFIIRQVPGGIATSYFFDELQPGAMVAIDAPYSIAHLRVNTGRGVALIAGGSGLAPILSILRGVMNSPLRDQTVMLVYGARTPNDVFPVESFPDISAFRNLLYVPIVSELPDDTASTWAGPTGFIHEHLAAIIGDGTAGVDYYMAGPPAMIDAVRRVLILNLKVPVNQIHYDRFY